MRANRMPLPKSLLCVSCNHTYPEGWKRCPYCGYDEKKAKDEARVAREAARRNPVNAKSSAAGQDSQKRRGPQDPRRRRGGPKPGERTPESRPQEARREGRAGNEPRRRGRRSEAGVKPPAVVEAASPALAAEPARRPARRRRGRARGGRSAEAGSPGANAPRRPSGIQENAPPSAAASTRPGPGEKGASAEGEGRSRRRRRPRRGRSRDGQPGDGSSSTPTE